MPVRVPSRPRDLTGARTVRSETLVGYGLEQEKGEVTGNSSRDVSKPDGSCRRPFEDGPQDLGGRRLKSEREIT